jgi:hypothetical protein
MSLKGRLKRLERSAQGDGIMLRQRDGTVRVFEWMEVQAALYLAQCDLLRDEPAKRENAVLDAVRNATPESRAMFEERFGPITFSTHIIAGGYQGGWVEARSLLEGGTVTKKFYPGGSPEAERVRREARQGGARMAQDA